MRPKLHMWCLLALLLAALLTMSAGCANQAQLCFGDISQVRLGQPGSGDGKWRVATDAEVERFVKYYAEARDFADDVGTTHPAVVEVTLGSGETLRVWGGGEEFQTVARGDQQWNIRSAALHKMMEQIARGESDVGKP